MQEYVAHSWYDYAGGKEAGLHPWDGVTEANFELGAATKGNRTNIEALDESAKYSWIKAPRWRGHAMEVGPLARYVIGYAQGNPEFKEPVDKVLTDLGLSNFELLYELAHVIGAEVAGSIAAAIPEPASIGPTSTG